MTTEASVPALPLWLVSESGFAAWRETRSAVQRAWIAAQDFRPERGRVLLLPGADGALDGAIGGLGAGSAVSDAWLGAQFAERLPAGSYTLAQPVAGVDVTQFALSWQLAQYRYSRYRTARARTARFESPDVDVAFVAAAAEAVCLARDLVNTPANDLGPEELAAAARTVATRHDGEFHVHEGNDLREGYPLIEAVGRGSPRAPRLIELRFPRAGAPRVVVVGKGVCFDSGGLDVKPSSGMLLMKKDMGGAACALGLASLLRRTDTPVDLTVLIPAVENAVDGFSFRPGDVFRSRKGITIEIGNTDAEGRLVLADALAAASELAPDLLIDLATLTGAARVALGPDLPAVFSGDASLAADLIAAGHALGDPLWQLPLWDGYDDDFSSRIADLNNVATHSFAGSIIGALFLRRFVADPARWLHVDLYAWNARDRPGRPQGGEGQCIRALHALIRQRWG